MYISNQCTHYTYIDKTVKKNEEFVNAKIKELKPDWTNHNARKIQLSVDKDCSFKINDEDILLIKQEHGLNIEYGDMDICSIESLTDNVKVYAIIGY